MIASPPLVSCLCVTRNKPEKLKRAFDCFRAQRYSQKELVIVYEDDDLSTQEVVDQLARSNSDVLAVKISSTPKLTLGQLRNIAISKARGAYFCQWDDDDWYHRDRISRQLEAALGNHKQACLLSNWIIFDELKREAYLSGLRPWEGTVLCRKDVVTSRLKYPAIPKKEDTIFTNFLIREGYIYPLVAPVLYIYVAHAGNTWHRAHFEEMFAWSQKLSEPTAKVIADILDAKHSVDEASQILDSTTIIGEFKYFQEHARIDAPFVALCKQTATKTLKAMAPRIQAGAMRSS